MSRPPPPGPQTRRTVDEDVVAGVFRAEFGRVVATLARIFGDLSIAEDAAQDAFVAALRNWPTQGLPPNPGGWLTITARRRAIDRLRSDAARQDRHDRAALVRAEAHHVDPDPMEDDRLRLIFTCCHPAIARHAQVALTLRLLGGLQTAEIARALLTSEAALGQRIVRAKRKIRAANVPYRVPDAHELPDRLAGVLAVVYLVFNEGHTVTAGGGLDRPDLSAEAIRLARLLVDLMPDEPEVVGLLALLLLTAARRPARTREDGSLIPLSEQDRRLWNPEAIAEGQSLVRRCLRRDRPGPYQLQAAIAAVHGDSASTGATDWRQILALYDRLLELAPTPVVALNRAVADAEVTGPAAALAAVDALGLEHYQPWHAARADLLRRLGAVAEAAEAYDRAVALTGNPAERRFLLERRASLVPAPSTGRYGSAPRHRGQDDPLPDGGTGATGQLPSRSQAKREAIRTAARELFLAGGYDGTSMDDVAARARVSKQTVYKQFTDKESLFEDIVLAEIASSEAETRELLDDLPERDDFVEGLQTFARRHVDGVLQPSIVALRRTVIAEANRFPSLARTWWERGPQAGHRTLAEVFTRAAANGHLRPLGDPLLAAQQFNWLVLVPLNAAMLLGHEGIDDEMDVHAVADDAVRVFLAAYGPEAASGGVPPG